MNLARLFPYFADTPFFRDVEEVQVFAENTDVVVKCPAYFGNPPTALMRWVNSNRRAVLNDTKFTPDDEQLTIRNIHLEEKLMELYLSM